MNKLLLSFKHEICKNRPVVREIRKERNYKYSTINKKGEKTTWTNADTLQELFNKSMQLIQAYVEGNTELVEFIENNEIDPGQFNYELAKELNWIPKDTIVRRK